MSRKIPDCKKCGRVHHNFEPCRGESRLQTPRIQLRRPRVSAEGLVMDFTDRLATVVSLSGDRIVGYPRGPMHEQER